MHVPETWGQVGLWNTLVSLGALCSSPGEMMFGSLLPLGIGKA